MTVRRSRGSFIEMPASNRLRIGAAWTAVVLTACASPPAPTVARDSVFVPARDENALFQTDSLRYTLREVVGFGYETRIRARFTNLTGATAYFVNCNGATMLHLEKLAGEQWTRAWSPIVPLCLSPPITVASGQSYEFGVPLFAAKPDANAAPKFTVPEIPGVYRIVWSDALSSYQDKLPFGAQLPLDQRVSNSFTLSVPSR